MSAVEDWLTSLSEANLSPRTIKSYRSTMAAYPPNPIAVTAEEAEAWWHAQADPEGGNRVATKQRRLHTVRSFYKYAIAYDLVVKDPTRRIRAPKQGRRLPTPISRADLHKAMGEADDEMRRALALGAYAGLRVAEVAALEWSHIDIETMRIRVRGKGDHDREVALGPLLLDSLLPNTGGNVVTGTDRAYSADALQRRVNRLFTRLGIEATFHKLRARYATVALAESGNLLAVSRALGHVSPATTAIYALTSSEDLDRIASAVER